MVKGQDPCGKSNRPGGTVHDAKSVSPFDFAANFAQLGVLKEEQLIPKLEETITRKNAQSGSVLFPEGWPQTDVELVSAAAFVVSHLAKKLKIVESPVRAATSVAGHFRQDAVLATLLHHFVDEPNLKKKVLTRVLQNRKKGGRVEADVQLNLDRMRSESLDNALLIAAAAAKITITPRDYVTHEGVNSEDFANTRRAIRAFPWAEVAVVKVADAESGLHNIDRAPYVEQEARMALGRHVYVELAKEISWDSMASDMLDAMVAKRNPTGFAAAVAEIEKTVGVKGLYTEPKAFERATWSVPQSIKGKLASLTQFKSEELLITGRRKSVYGFQDKKAKKGAVSDGLGYRVIIPNGANREEDHVNCIQVMAAFEKMGFKRIPGEYTDHIATEKLYDSVHNVFRFQGMKIEVQVRTVDMHWDAELKPGVSHIDYNKSGHGTDRGAIKASDLDDLHRVSEVRASIAAQVLGKPIETSRPENIFCFDGHGRATQLPNIGSSIMDALVNANHESKDVQPADVIRARYVCLNGKRLDMTDAATRSIEIANGDSLIVDPKNIDKSMRIAPEWLGHMATNYAREIIATALTEQIAIAKPQLPPQALGAKPDTTRKPL
jgi:(p)ppGpp synthase/HD superfamily hydrolase